MLIAVPVSWVTTPWRSVNVPAGLLDEQAHGGDVVGGDADGVDGHVERALGDEGVLPEVAEAPRPPGVHGQADQRRRQPELVPAVVQRHADLGVGDGGDVGHPAAPAVGERAPARRRPPPAAQRRRRDHADDDAVSAWASAISVAHTGMPRT